MQALFTSSGKDSLSRNAPDGAIRDEGIAVAMAEERSAADGVLQASESLTEEPSKADIGLLRIKCHELVGYSREVAQGNSPTL